MNSRTDIPLITHDICSPIHQYLHVGHDRNVPGFERISMPGDPASGDVSLQIRNLTVNDAGEYECQVTPSKNQPLLRRKTRLHVTGEI